MIRLADFIDKNGSVIRALCMAFVTSIADAQQTKLYKILRGSKDNKINDNNHFPLTCPCI